MFLKKTPYYLSHSFTQPENEIFAKFDKDDLSNALSAVSAVQIDSEIGWIQLNFLGNNSIIISAISHSLSIKYEIQTNYVGQGVIKLSGRQLSEYVKQLPNAPIDFKVEFPSRVLLKCAGSSAKIQLIHDPIHSEFSVPEKAANIVLKGETIERWLSYFREFVCVDDHRFYANGALIGLEINGQNKQEYFLNAVASDAIRLAKISLVEGFKVTDYSNSKVLVPRKALEELKRICIMRPSQDFNISWNDQNLSFSVETENYTMTSKCITGNYPPYEAALPQIINLEISVDLKTIQDSVKRSLLFADKNRVIKMHFEGSLMNLESFTPGQKEGEEVLEINPSVGSSFEVYYDGHLLSGILSILQGSRANFAWENISRPVRITGETERGIEGFYLLVPARF
ncbi:MAG: hypothetical protein K2X39_01775 [Silvanigrellaceae bacterium]|nr:hypothetical protein [Silvanigrellaceae bacterium]